jgi:GNAT superfamily N-acetyltransferase
VSAVLRPATTADLASLVALEHLVFPDDRDRFDVAGVFARPDAMRAAEYFPVVEAEGDLLGFAFLAMSSAVVDDDSETTVADQLTAELVRLVVHPAARGQGVASKLVEVVERAALETGYRQVVAHTTDAGAARLRAAGWSVSERGAFVSWSVAGGEVLPRSDRIDLTLKFGADVDRSVSWLTFDEDAVLANRRARLAAADR